MPRNNYKSQGDSHSYPEFSHYTIFNADLETVSLKETFFSYTPPLSPLFEAVIIDRDEDKFPLSEPVSPQLSDVSMDSMPSLLSLSSECDLPVIKNYSVDSDDDDDDHKGWAKFVVHPVQREQLWNLYKQAEASFWTAEEIDLTTDVIHWRDHLTDTERTYFSRVLAFFAVADGIVNENIVERLCSVVPIKEAKFFYGFQCTMENIHSETYSMLITSLVEDTDEQDKLFSAVAKYPSIRAKARWCMKWIKNDHIPLAWRVVAFAAVEGIFFSSSFASIFWVKQRGLMPGMTYSNELISRDEGLHTRFACTLLQHLTDHPSQELILDMITTAVDLEKSFVSESLKSSLQGLTVESMHTYIEFVADTLLSMLQLNPVYNVENPFPFMTNIALDGKANFFERKVSEYHLSHLNTSGTGSMNKSSFSTTAPF
ncbi:ribonucleotide reductase [Hygrophoropsis aurantiaca]|uniref:Ribonucleotide reductase n=1 Tax=Hygrophoropsis aurantiaca TaxID=72124 RepID=A0ACB8A8J4_9AGAM|nr:ribonucleotide reductase [Hygrophoropsis aurantiaca]